MRYEFGKVCYLNYPQHLKHGKRVVMIDNRHSAGDMINVVFEEDGDAKYFGLRELSETPPKRKVKKTVWIGIGERLQHDSDVFGSSACLNASKIPIGYRGCGVHAIEIEVEEP